MHKKIYVGPTLLISNFFFFVLFVYLKYIQGAMSMSGIPKGVPVVFAHGKNDLTIPVQSVHQRASSGSKHLIQIFEYDDDHGLHTLENTPGEMEKLIYLVYSLREKVKQEDKQETPQIVSPMSSLLESIRKNKK